MAYDKVIDSSALNSKLTAIANAIRAKTGNTGTLTLDQMPTEIESIETETEIPDGYIIPTGSVTITENGTHDVTEKASVVVAVPETEITLQNKEITENGTYIADTGYDGLGQVTVNVASSGGEISEEDYIDMLLTTTVAVIDSNVTTVRTYACYNMTTLATINLPLATNIGTYAFYNCANLTSVNAPNVSTLGTYVFARCSKLTEINLPLVTRVNTGCFDTCSALKIADFAVASQVTPQSFKSTTSLKALILRKADAIATLSNVNAFTSSTIASGTGYIYVPRALVDTYKAATNWSTYASQFRALEDYTVDGTTTGALDESKI